MYFTIKSIRFLWNDFLYAAALAGKRNVFLRRKNPDKMRTIPG